MFDMHSSDMLRSFFQLRTAPSGWKEPASGSCVRSRPACTGWSRGKWTRVAVTRTWRRVTWTGCVRPTPRPITLSWPEPTALSTSNPSTGTPRPGGVFGMMCTMGRLAILPFMVRNHLLLMHSAGSLLRIVLRFPKWSTCTPQRYGRTLEGVRLLLYIYITLESIT